MLILTTSLIQGQSEFQESCIRLRKNIRKFNNPDNCSNQSFHNQGLFRYILYSGLKVLHNKTSF